MTPERIAWVVLGVSILSIGLSVLAALAE